MSSKCSETARKSACFFYNTYFVDVLFPRNFAIYRRRYFPILAGVRMAAGGARDRRPGRTPGSLVGDFFSVARALVVVHLAGCHFRIRLLWWRYLVHNNAANTFWCKLLLFEVATSSNLTPSPLSAIYGIFIIDVAVWGLMFDCVINTRLMCRE